MRPSRWSFLTLAILTTLLLVGSAVAHSSAASAQTIPALHAAATRAGGYAIYLPLIIGAPASPAPPSGGGTAGDSATFWLPQHDLAGAGIATTNPQVAVDPAGGIHIAYRISARTSAGTWPAFYMHCATNCAEPAHWTRLALSNDVIDVRLQLDAAGHPRLLLKAYAAQQPYDWIKQQGVQYAACDSGCDEQANWKVTAAATSFYAEPYTDESTNHYFALDRAGHPGFVYMDFQNPADEAHSGTFYAYCQAVDPRACSDAANWSEHRISPQNLVRGDIVYTHDNQARFLMTYTPDDYAVKLVYIACDATCNTLDFVSLWDTDGHAHWSLRLDHADRPRFALYSGWYINDFPSRQVFYVWCDADCLTLTNWQHQALTPQAPAQQQLDMQLDAQDRPHVVFNTSYTWCTAQCESSQGDWPARVVETSSTLNQLYPVPVPTDCSESTWASGSSPTLALDPQGSPRITFVAQHVTAGMHRSNGRRCDGTVDVIWARFSMFAQP
jgi:hypothetical protein